LIYYKKKYRNWQKKYRNEWKEELWESTKIEEYGLNEYFGGKAEAYEDCLYLINNIRKKSKINLITKLL